MDSNMERQGKYLQVCVTLREDVASGAIESRPGNKAADRGYCWGGMGRRGGIQ